MGLTQAYRHNPAGKDVSQTCRCDLCCAIRKPDRDDLCCFIRQHCTGPQPLIDLGQCVWRGVSKPNQPGDATKVIAFLKTVDDPLVDSMIETITKLKDKHHEPATTQF